MTYPDHGVEQELEGWVFARLDATGYPQAARELGVRAVPVAVALHGGRILGRRENFVEAPEFRDWLRALRAEASQ